MTEQPTPTSCWKCGAFEVPLHRPLIMGVVNVTPDSFSDGGTHASVKEAIEWGKCLLDEGADILDIGGESTRPGSDEVAPAEEAARILPVIAALSALGAIVSVDTRHAEVAAAALEAGAHIVNDVSGFRDPQMVKVVTGSDCGLVVMHMLGEPKSMQQEPCYGEVVTEIAAYLQKQATMLEEHGIARERIAIDPGPGFGKTTVHDLQIQRRFDEFCRLGYPVVEACSRKRFLGDVTGEPVPANRDLATVAATLLAARQGARILRVHNVAALHQALCVLERPELTGYVALGSNVGHGLETLAAAREKIAALPLTRVTGSSHAFATEPAYVTDQPSFTNAVIRIESALDARALLAHLNRLEAEFGRVRTLKDGPRTLDLDLIAYAGETSAGSCLTLPHPRAYERDFVLRPLEDLLTPAQIAALLAPRVPLAPAQRHGRVLEDLGEF